MPESSSQPPAGPNPDKFERRAFFREGLRNLFKPVADLVEKRIDNIQSRLEASRRARPDWQGDGQPEAGAGAVASPRIIRPPGAMKEEVFLTRCVRSGECIDACPVQAIRPLQTEDSRLNGTPVIEPQLQACVVCEELACMQTCPSGALQKLPRHLINMGVAEVHIDRCVRANGEECQICVDKCPIGPAAIHIPYHGASIEVKTDGCIGCGVCEMYCPTAPKAIVIR